MASVQHVFRRGAVYWWRRQFPEPDHLRSRLLIEFSLRTKSIEIARRVAAEVTAESARLMVKLRSRMIAPEEARNILVKVAVRHSAKLEAVAASEIAYDNDPETSRMADIAAGWAYRLYAAQGDRVYVSSDDERQMRAAGLDQTMITTVVQQLLFFIENGVLPPKRQKIEALLDEFGIDETRTNFQQAQGLYLRGMAAALLDVGRRWTGVRPEDDALLQSALLANAKASASSQPASPIALSQPPSSVHSLQPIPVVDAAVELDEEDEEDEDIAPQVGLIQIVEDRGYLKTSDKEWSEKTKRQHISLARLFCKFVGHDNPAKMTQTHISEFRLFLAKLPKTYGKSPKDEALSVAEILALSESLPPEKVGRDANTVNRYMTQLSNIVQFCKSRGLPFGSYEGVSDLRIKIRDDRRQQRAPFTTDDLSTLFSLPVWHGSKAPDERCAPGELVIHDSSYWLPLLGAYTGGRREELAALLLSEVHTETAIPHIEIKPNSVRGLKTVVSLRKIPIHPELLRLGFVEYVAALKACEHTLLFPELKAAAESTPMGDVFDDDWRTMRDKALPEAAEKKQVFHSFRHWANNEMYQAGVAQDLRQDILGHTSEDENTGRYTDPARLGMMAEALAVLPQPTSHIEPHFICLRNDVITHRPPPTKGKALPAKK